MNIDSCLGPLVTTKLSSPTVQRCVVANQTIGFNLLIKKNLFQLFLMSEVWRIGWLDISTLDVIEPSTRFLERQIRLLAQKRCAINFARSGPFIAFLYLFDVPSDGML